MNQQTNLFDLAQEEKIDIKKDTLKVVQATMVDKLEMTWQELFEGFNELYVITFSSGIDFTCNVVNQFEYAEIIYGNEDVIQKDISAIMAVQTDMISRIAKTKSAKGLSKRIDGGSLKMFISRNINSHEKIYCLKSDDGHTRVITGSANMSATAFYGIQRENILYFDDAKAFQYYFDLFNEFKETCSDEINSHSLLPASESENEFGSNIDDIPITNTLKKEQVIYLDPALKKAEEEIQFVAEVKGHEEELRNVLPKPRVQNKKQYYKVEDIVSVRKKMKDLFKIKKEKEHQNPKLHIDYENRAVSFNGVPYDLNPIDDAVKNDVNCVLNFFDGLSEFNYDWKGAQKNYFLFMNWYFSSVFMAKLRMVAHANNYDQIDYPVIGMIYGESNGGKSKFASLLAKLLSGQIILESHSSDFTYSEIEKLKSLCEGLPIYIDDLSKSQYANNYEKIIKDDQWGIDTANINYPAVAISTNNVASLTPDIFKRIITCKINTKVSVEQGKQNSKRVKESISKATNALFSRYMNRMFDVIEEMEEIMKTGDQSTSPDIFKASSTVLCEIIKECVDSDLPDYIRIVDTKDYFSDRAIAENAIKKIINVWETEPQKFMVNKKNNTVTYTFGESSYYDMKKISDELPISLNPKIASTSLMMNLKESQEFFNIKFRKKLFGGYE